MQNKATSEYRKYLKLIIQNGDIDTSLWRVSNCRLPALDKSIDARSEQLCHDMCKRFTTQHFIATRLALAKNVNSDIF